MIQGSYRETGAHGKWVDESLAKGLQEVNIKGQSTRRMSLTLSKTLFKSQATMSEVVVTLLENGEEKEGERGG
jgi:hypothetical protein